jgi:actin-related protein 8
VFNESGYTTRQELLGDIQLIIEDALNEQIGIEASEYATYAALLVIPDLFEKTYIYEMNRMLFTMGFSKVAILQVPPPPEFPPSCCIIG